MIAMTSGLCRIRHFICTLLLLFHFTDFNEKCRDTGEKSDFFKNESRTSM